MSGEDESESEARAIERGQFLEPVTQRKGEKWVDRCCNNATRNVGRKGAVQERDNGTETATVKIVSRRRHGSRSGAERGVQKSARVPGEHEYTNSSC